MYSDGGDGSEDEVSSGDAAVPDLVSGNHAVGSVGLPGEGLAMAPDHGVPTSTALPSLVLVGTHTYTHHCVLYTHTHSSYEMSLFYSISLRSYTPLATKNPSTF